MRTEKRVVYPYVSLDVKGNFNSIGVYTWKIEDNLNLEHGFIHIALPPMEVEVPVPDDEQLRKGALQMLQTHRDKLRGEFQATLTKLQMLENNLLRIGTSEGVEVLDAVDVSQPHRLAEMQQPGEFGEGTDEDIPF